MNEVCIKTINGLKKVYTNLLNKDSLAKLSCEKDPTAVSDIMYQYLVSDAPCMIARFGAFELNTVVNYLGVSSSDTKSIVNYIGGTRLSWWWDSNLLRFMLTNAGFFPSTPTNAKRFSEMMLSDIKELDVLGSWLVNEQYFLDQLRTVVLVQREIQNPFFTDFPWTKALEGKKVLVVHPFADLITYQYEHNREKLFQHKDVLPSFTLKTIQAVQSIGGDSEFNDWFEALDWMKSEIDTVDYDVCLIGCGAYGFPLAAHVKRQGKKAVHLGGSLQLLFGIKGARWERSDYNKEYNYARLMNEYWVKPGSQFKPKNSENVEGGCYW